jgi:type II secretory ATPase GspE/PulE/Tfp pilus assembly ATPase PilB-like protein
MVAEISKRITGEVQVALEIVEKIKNVLDFKKEMEGAIGKPAKNSSILAGPPESKSFGGDITEVLEIILGGAIGIGASDVHIEPEEGQVKLRIRFDGILQDVLLLSKDIYENILSRIKLLSGIKLNIADRPQDGRFSIITGALLIEVRVSALPTEYGETIVLRILNPKSLVSLQELGLREDLLKLFYLEIKKPNGMIIVTGPTGSGKTTTLYAFLKEIRSPKIKIITIEDPIEYHLDGISQTQTAPGKGYNFASGLRSIMRQDPDVILVGEIRDLETADIALQAALTGHFVLTTLHTNDAAGTVARLINLGVKPADIGPALNIAIAQRLVRRVCQKCVKFEKPLPEELNKIKKELKSVSKKINPSIMFRVNAEQNRSIKIPKAVGCQYCNSTGYRGRVGLFEAFLIDSEMEKFIFKNPSIAELKEKAVENGMITIKQDGFIKVLEGVTTIEEVERVAGE